MITSFSVESLAVVVVSPRYASSVVQSFLLLNKLLVCGDSGSKSFPIHRNIIISFHIRSCWLLKLTLRCPILCIDFHLDVRRDNSKTSALRRVPLLGLLLELLASFHHKGLDFHSVPSYLLFSAFDLCICFVKSIVIGVCKSLPCWCFTLLHILQ